MFIKKLMVYRETIDMFFIDSYLFLEKHMSSSSFPKSRLSHMGKGVSHLETGRKGENLACAYLVENGYRIVQRNYRKKFGEIDIAALSPEGVLVFVEVKTSGSSWGGFVPEDQFSVSKRRKFLRICRAFSQSYSTLAEEARGWRVDFIAVELDTKQPREHTIRHYENI